MAAEADSPLVDEVRREGAFAHGVEAAEATVAAAEVGLPLVDEDALKGEAGVAKVVADEAEPASPNADKDSVQIAVGGDLLGEASVPCAAAG